MTATTRVSNRIYWALVVMLAGLAAANLFLPQGDFVPTMPTQELPASKPVMALAVFALIFVLYGGLGWLGLWLTRKLGWPDLWDPGISNHRRFVMPAVVGAASGLFLIIADTIFSRFRSWGAFPHPPFPTSLVASLVAGIGEEIIFRLFFITVWVWLLSHLLLRGRWQTGVFWFVAIWSALVFGLGHLPAVMVILGLQEFTAIPPVLLGEILLLNGVVGLLTAFYLRKAGFLAAVGIHFWADVVWHVLWGFMQQM